MAEKLVKSKERVKKYGEVFTPKHIVKEMSDLVEPDISDPFKKVLEPACGDGNFLVEVLKRKLDKVKNEYEFLMAVGNIYGVELLPDNRDEAILRLFKILAKDDRFKDFVIKNTILLSHILDDNIKVGNFLEDDLDFKVWDFEKVETDIFGDRYVAKTTVKRHRPVKR